MATGNRRKHLDFTFARKEVYFLLGTFKCLDKYFFSDINCLEYCKSSKKSFLRYGTVHCHGRLSYLTYEENSKI